MSAIRHLRFFQFSVANLIYIIFVIVFGAFVRVTGSGAGCGDHWPSCQGAIVPRAPELETIIEFSHRLTSGLAGIFVLILWIWSWRLWGRRSEITRTAFIVCIFILLEALIGMALVKAGLVADNASMLRAWVMAAHLVNTLLLIAVATILVAMSGGYSFRKRHWTSLWKHEKTRLCFIGLLGFLLVSASGAIAALGDTLFPATSLKEGMLQDFTTEAHILLKLRIWHPIFAVALAAFWIFMSLSNKRDDKPIRSGLFKGFTLGQLVLLSISMQVIVGIVNLLLLAPAYMQLIHLATANICFIAAFYYFLETFPTNAKIVLAPAK